MLEINGREIGLFYSVWAHCEWNDWILKNQDRSYASALVQKAVIMSKAYCDENGGKPLATKEILNLPEYVFEELSKAVMEQEAADSVRTVETDDSDAKNAESAAQ